MLALMSKAEQVCRSALAILLGLQIHCGFAHGISQKLEYD